MVVRCFVVVVVGKVEKLETTRRGVDDKNNKCKKKKSRRHRLVQKTYIGK